MCSRNSNISQLYRFRDKKLKSLKKSIGIKLEIDCTDLYLAETGTLVRSMCDLKVIMTEHLTLCFGVELENMYYSSSSLIKF